MMTNLLLANQEHMAIPTNITDETIKIKLHELGFCSTKPHISKIKHYVKHDTSMEDLENIILEYM